MANNMKPLLILFLSSLIVFSHCENIGEKEKPSALKKFNESVLLVCFIGRFMGNTETRITDNKDGTIALTEVIIRGTDYCLLPLGKTESINVRYYIKKCIQGQVYRSAQNDCKGSGTAANYYSAQKLQACSTNDNACDDSIGKQSKTLSPARASCINDKTAGLSWDNEYSFSVGKEYNLSKYLANRADELPVSDTDYYWDSGFGAGNIFGGGVGAQSKDTSNYVMCFRKG